MMHPPRIPDLSWWVGSPSHTDCCRIMLLKEALAAVAVAASRGPPTSGMRGCQVNEDISAEIPCLAETGPFSIPLQCCIKKARLSVSPAELQLGSRDGTVLGELASHSFLVSNAGALEVEYTLVLQEVSR
jgi:hypothetical protein